MLPNPNERQAVCPQCQFLQTIYIEGSYGGPRVVKNKCKKCGAQLLSDDEVFSWARNLEHHEGIS